MVNFSLLCPLTKKILTVASDNMLNAFNAQLEIETVEFQNGDKVSEPFQGMLVEKTMSIAYPIKSGIPQLIPLLSVSLAGLNRGISFD